MLPQTANPAAFVARVNEIYHDVEGAGYLNRHRSIFVDEAKRWDRLARQFIARADPVTVLDLGTGTGFVPLRVAPHLKPSDRVICADVSSVMLDVCRRKLEAGNFRCRFEFVNIGMNFARSIRGPVDVVTMNSVLHHIYSVTEAVSQIEGLLSDRGLLIIAHEPNRAFYANAFLHLNCRVLDVGLHPLATARHMLRRIGLAWAPRRVAQTSDKTTARVNARLLEEGLIERPLTSGELACIVDFHSPTAGRDNRGKGFDLRRLLQHEMCLFEPLYFETYNHCGRPTTANWFTRGYGRILAGLFPRQGATFAVVLRRRGVAGAPRPLRLGPRCEPGGCKP
jgi:ubiquinone/menaquinone biosynthesis C-methylase UbiE